MTEGTEGQSPMLPLNHSDQQVPVPRKILSLVGLRATSNGAVVHDP